MKPLGIVIVLSSALCYAILSVLLKKANQNLQPFTVMAISMLVLFSLSFIASVFFENSLSIDVKSNIPAIWILVLVGIINFIGFWLAIKGYQYMPLWTQQMFSILNPVLTGIFAYFILKETLSWKLFLGLVFMAIGLVIAII